jgi:hypothetical protein
MENLNNLTYFKPDKKKISKERLYKIMLAEAINIIFLEIEGDVGLQAIRARIKKKALQRLNKSTK